MNDCSVDGCERLADGPYCSAHAKRRQRGKVMAGKVRDRVSTRERVQGLAIALADADSDDDHAYRAAWEALRKAAEDWIVGLTQKRAALARWAGTTPEERSEAARKAAMSGTPAERSERARKAVVKRWARYRMPARTTAEQADDEDDDHGEDDAQGAAGKRRGWGG